MLFTEEQLKLYSKPLSESEKEKCENAIRIIQESLESLGYEIKKGLHRNNEDTLSYQIKMTNPSKDYELSIFVKGSYATNTNVRQNSDVDIAVVKESEFFDKYREGKTRENYKFISSNKPPYHFKDEVEEALIERFGRSEVRRGNKAIRINGNTYRKETDCVPCFRYRDYS
ncbi:nucleotidyltransferase, partial [Staphylococcus aureus]